MLLACLALAPFARAAPVPPDAGLDDAERFGALMKNTAFRPSAGELQRHYLAEGSDALSAFAAGRIGNAEALHDALEGNTAAYRHAIDHCLPAARRLAARDYTDRKPPVVDAVALYLGEPVLPRPEVVYLLGAGRSAGTVIDGRVIVALEVACRFLEPDEDATAMLAAFVLHETVHVHQLRHQRPEATDSLLRQAMLEGFADYVTEELIQAVPPPARLRSAYGRAHEAELWADFREDMAGSSLGDWMYGPGPDAVPADMGYWMGRQISAAYLDQSAEKAKAIQELLLLKDPFALLEASGYDGGVSEP